MKLLVTQLASGDNPLHYESKKDSWLKEFVLKLSKNQSPIVGNFTIDANLTKLDPDYYLRGKMEYGLTRVCNRCAEEFTQPVEHQFQLALAHVKNGDAPDPSLTEESEELDINYFANSEIQLDPLLEEQFTLSIPYEALCQPNCLGLCQSCGQNRNKGTCKCKAENPLNPFTALKDWNQKH